MKDSLKGILYVALFAIPFIPLIVTDSLFFPFITGKNFTFRILVEIAFAAWVLLSVYDVKYRPKFSWVAVSFTALIMVMFFANFFGQFPLKSFWSNFERMEGYVTLVHVYMLVLALGSALRTPKAWDWFFNTTLFAASILSLYAFGQLSGNFNINQGGLRVDGTLGNAAYMAVYMLFHVFIALIMFVRSKQTYAKAGYGFLFLVFLYLLVQTATRGTAIGLVGGLMLAGLYTALFTKDAPQVRRYALVGVVAVVVIAGGMFAAKDTKFISENPILGRVVSISLSDGATRFQIWNMALEGVKERPVLGWGQGNFSYVFNKYYEPKLYAQEPWFDRVHNIVLDWLIAGGIVGFLAYVSIFAAALYYLVFRPRVYGDGRFSTIEQGLIFGLLGAYFVHNVFVFDNIVSYIFFGIILAFIHSRISEPIPAVDQYKVPMKIANNIAAPVVLATLCLVVYLVNIPGIQAAGDVIDGFTARSPEQMLSSFERALSRNSFGNQEIREQLTQRTQQITNTEGVSKESKDAILARTEAELLKQIEEKPGDARVYVFVSSFYRSVGQMDKAREQLELARKYSPKKQQIIFEQGFVELQSNNFDKASEYFKEAFESEPTYDLARTYYAASLLYAGRADEARELVGENHIRAFSQNSIAMNAAANARAYDLLIAATLQKVEDEPETLQHRVSLSAVYYDSGDKDMSIATLEQAVVDFPDFKTQGDGFIADIKAGRKPGSVPATVTGSGGEVIEAVVN
jgi:O-antigen ligase/tetratricopeptide (TPR) repeat protein